jgi:hypothetical protein
MKTNCSKVALVGCLALFLTACGQVVMPTSQYDIRPSPNDTTLSPTVNLPVVEIQTRPATSMPTKEPEQESTQMTQTTLPPFSSSLEFLIEKAKQDLALRLGVSVDSITVVTVIGQEFSTDAFYCRSTKERIARDESPAVISGFSILLRASGHRYEYHASDQTIIFCRPLP